MSENIAVKNTDSVEVDENEERRIWRLLYPEALDGVEYGGVGGIASYKPSNESLRLGKPHKNAELYYVVKGQGLFATPAGETPIREGDAFVTPPGVPHSLWSTTDDELLTFYVAIRR